MRLKRQTTKSFSPIFVLPTFLHSTSYNPSVFGIWSHRTRADRHTTTDKGSYLKTSETPYYRGRSTYLLCSLFWKSLPVSGSTSDRCRERQQSLRHPSPSPRTWDGGGDQVANGQGERFEYEIGGTTRVRCLFSFHQERKFQTRGNQVHLPYPMG